jgi:hypothetical protein
MSKIQNHWNNFDMIVFPRSVILTTGEELITWLCVDLIFFKKSMYSQCTRNVLQI